MSHPKHSKLGSVPSQTFTEDDQALRHHASTLKWDPSIFIVHLQTQG